jgi:hypothetical protein
VLALAAPVVAHGAEAELTEAHAGPITLGLAATFDAIQAVFPKAKVHERTVTEFAGQPYPVLEVVSGKKTLARLVSFDKQRLTFVQVLTPTWRTADALGVGSTYAELAARYPDLACRISDMRWQDVACTSREHKWLSFEFAKVVTAQDQMAITMGSGDATGLVRKKRVTSVGWNADR